MRHLDHAAALALVQGGGDDVERQHVAVCARCRRLAEECTHLLAGLQAVAEAPAPPQRLLRWARAYALTMEPAPNRWRALQLLSQGTPLVATTRAAARTGAALLYGDDRHQVDLRIVPTRSGRCRLHGQIVPLASSPVSPWLISAVGPEGEVVRTTSDDLGEFWLPELESWNGASLVATSGEDRVVVACVGPPLGAGGDGGPT